MTNVHQQQLLYCLTWSSNQLLNLNIFFFFRLFCLSVPFLSVLTLESSVIQWLTCFRVFGCFLCFFGYCECCLPCISCVMCHTRREKQLEQHFLRKYFLVFPRDFSDLGHTFSWQLFIKRLLKSFWQYVQKRKEKKKKN